MWYFSVRGWSSVPFQIHLSDSLCKGITLVLHQQNECILGWNPKRNKNSKVWWVGYGWMLGSHQSSSINPLLSWTGDGKCNERLLFWNKYREVGHQLLSQAKQTRLGEINLSIKTQSRIIRNENKSQNTFPPPIYSWWAQLYSVSLPSPF